MSMFAMFDPIYWLLVLPPLLLGLWAQARVKSSFARYSKVRPSSGLSGAEAAEMMLHRSGLAGRVTIERVRGFLSDHYDPRHKVLRLSPEVYDGRSLAAVGVACHEAGHALQDARHYAPLVLRNAIVPTANIGSSLGLLMIIIGGLILQIQALAVAGLVLFGCVVVFQLVNLPVEFDASSRAKQMLGEMGVISGPQESNGVAAVLNAAAMTYVAATLQTLMVFLYYAYLVFGRRN